MAQEKQVLGYIDCPCCGTKDGLRITADKNGEPFGFCEAECNLQIRIGGNARRVALFVARHPWAKKPVTVTEQQPDPVREQEQEPEPKKTPPRERFAFGL